LTLSRNVPWIPDEVIQEKAQQFRKEFPADDFSEGNELVYPIGQAVELGLGLDLVPKPGLYQRAGEIRGYLTLDRNEIYIDKECLMKDAYETNYRFCLAHEVGHLYLHKTFWEEAEGELSSKISDPVEAAIDILNRVDEQNHKRLEYQCSAFASYALVPLNLFREVYENQVEGTLRRARDIPPSISTDEAFDFVLEDIAEKTARQFKVHYTTTKPQIARAGLEDDLKRRIQEARKNS
jgi:Zn-dependent peptidase ImmA (M78 family)